MNNTDIKQSLSDQSEQMKKLHGIVKKDTFGRKIDCK